MKALEALLDSISLRESVSRKELHTFITAMFVIAQSPVRRRALAIRNSPSADTGRQTAALSAFV